MGKVETWDNDLIQFARLLCEIVATQEVNFDALCESMDLEKDDLNNVFDRAHEAWEAAKKATWENGEDTDGDDINDSEEYTVCEETGRWQKVGII